MDRTGGLQPVPTTRKPTAHTICARAQWRRHQTSPRLSAAVEPGSRGLHCGKGGLLALTHALTRQLSVIHARSAPADTRRAAERELAGWLRQHLVGRGRNGGGMSLAGGLALLSGRRFHSPDPQEFLVDGGMVGMIYTSTD